MTQDEIIEMARESGFVEYELDDGTTTAFDKRYEAFANLVAAKEREACAKVCDIGVDTEHPTVKGHIMKNFGASSVLAAAIRTRGEA